MYRIESASASLMESETVWLTILPEMGLRVIEPIRAWPSAVADHEPNASVVRMRRKSLIIFSGRSVAAAGCRRDFFRLANFGCRFSFGQ
ncbi:MAG TPA: hypothetical protein QGH16_06350 [Verrucomicrobiota bacterium]|nr:hypothetical protein [Verrucomicrobiota bacterium]